MSDPSQQRVFIGAPGADLDDAGKWLEVGYTHGHVPRPADDDLLDIGDTIEGFQFPTEERLMETYTFTIVPPTPATSDWFNIATGGAAEVAEEPPTQSITFDTTETVPGDPPAPRPRTGWRGLLDRITGRHQHQLALWCIRYKTWVAMGCPDTQRVTRFYIPRARIEAAP